MAIPVDPFGYSGVMTDEFPSTNIQPRGSLADIRTLRKYAIETLTALFSDIDFLPRVTPFRVSLGKLPYLSDSDEYTITFETAGHVCHGKFSVSGQLLRSHNTPLSAVVLELDHTCRDVAEHCVKALTKLSYDTLYREKMERLAQEQEQQYAFNYSYGMPVYPSSTAMTRNVQKPKQESKLAVATALRRVKAPWPI